MRKFLAALAALVAFTLPAAAADNYGATVGSGLTFAAKSVGGVLYPWWIPANSSGTELFTSGNPGYVQSADGGIATIGTEADAAWTSGSGTLIALGKANAGFLSTIATNTAAMVPAGSNLIGGVEMYDGGGVQKATIKAASTAAAATDTSVVAQINPEQPNLTTALNVFTPTTTNGGATLAKGGVGTVNGASNYQTQAASTSITALTGGSGGAAGDYLSHCTVIPTTVSPGVFTITDNSTAIYSFPGGASSLSNLVPFTVPVGAVSQGGAWKITTGAGLSVVCVGKFT